MASFLQESDIVKEQTCKVSTTANFEAYILASNPNILQMYVASSGDGEEGNPGRQTCGKRDRHFSFSLSAVAVHGSLRCSQSPEPLPCLLANFPVLQVLGEKTVGKILHARKDFKASQRRRQSPGTLHHFPGIAESFFLHQIMFRRSDGDARSACLRCIASGITCLEWTDGRSRLLAVTKLRT